MVRGIGGKRQNHFTMTLFISLFVVSLLVVGFFILHIYLPDRAERRKLQRKLDNYPKAYLSVAEKDDLDFLLSVDNDSAIHADDWGICSELEFSEG